MPADAPPSAADTVVYSVVAELDRKIARDARAEQRLTVLSGETQYADRLERSATSPSEAHIDLQTATREVRAGDAVTFVARVTGVEDLEARALKASILGFREDQDGCVPRVRRRRSDPRRARSCLKPGVTSTEHRGTVTWSPRTARPTFTAAHNELRWLPRRAPRPPS